MDMLSEYQVQKINQLISNSEPWRPGLPRSLSTIPGVVQWQNRPPLKARLWARTEVLATRLSQLSPFLRVEKPLENGQKCQKCCGSSRITIWL